MNQRVGERGSTGSISIKATFEATEHRGSRWWRRLSRTEGGFGGAASLKLGPILQADSFTATPRQGSARMELTSGRAECWRRWWCW